MIPGVLIYKCRRCGAEMSAVMVPDLYATLARISRDLPLAGSFPGFPPGTLDVHCCADGKAGIADLIGGERVRAEPDR